MQWLVREVIMTLRFIGRDPESPNKRAVPHEDYRPA
jgi:hypothetical protein